jgi:predicted transposase/invertase (TIGR01784 family)
MMTTGNNYERPLVSFDWALKRLLRNKANYEVVEGFLSELLGRTIVVKSILESASNKMDSMDKSNVVDVVVEDEKGEIFLIELQFMIEMDYFQRMLYGTSKTLTERLNQGDEYANIKKIYSISVVYFDLGQGLDYVYHGKTNFLGMHNHDVLLLSEKQSRVFGKIEAGALFPEYYILKINNFDDVAKDTLDEWIYFLKHNRIKAGSTARGLEKANEVLYYHTLSPEDKAEYDYEQNVRSHELSRLATAKYEVKFDYEKIIEEKDKALSEQAKVLSELTKRIAELEQLLNKK